MSGELASDLDRTKRSEFGPLARRPATSRQIIWSTLAGFIAGAFCWHLIGFWSFVKEAVLFSKPETVVQASGRSLAPLKAQNRAAGAASTPQALATAGNCTAAVRAGQPGETQASACEPVAFKFRPSRNAERADRGDFGPSPVPILISGGTHADSPAPAVGGWSARIDR